MFRRLFLRAVAVWLVGALLACGAERGDGAAPTGQDAQALARVLAASQALMAELDKAKPLFQRKSDQPLTPDERARLLALWAPLIDHDLAYVSYRKKFLTSWKQAPTPEDQTRKLVLGMAALTAQVAANLKLLGLVGKQDVLRKALDEASPEVGVSAGHFSRILRRTAQPETMLTLQIGLDALRRRLDGSALHSKVTLDEKFQAVADKTLAAAETVDGYYDRSLVHIAYDAATTTATQILDDVTSPLITDIAVWLGDTRVRSKGKSLISAEQVDWLQTQLDPGDVLVERRNWYLSNLGLPGFWPHAELYSGTAAELAEAFDQDPQVAKAFPGGLTAHLAKTYPDKWKHFQALAEDGRPHRILEAISEGVSFTSLHEAAQADYVAALRPRLSKLAKARAIDRAFAHQGKPYDFDFDFLTLSELVCSELVYQAYLPGQGDPVGGLTLPLSEVMGRLTLPPNEIVELYAQQAGTPQQQLDFVAFLDGREAEHKAAIATEADLRASWQRPKWDLSQQ